MLTTTDESKLMKIGILQTGRSPDELLTKHGDYDDLFKRLLAGRGFVFETYKVLDGDLPTSVDAAEGWLITGSKFGVYEDHDWIDPLEAFLRNAFVAKVPIIGVCFGHQILAQALGGKVEKFDGGWSVGPTCYTDSDENTQKVIAWHQDQVTQLPADAKVVGASEFCENAMLAYGDTAFTMQPHPEFTGGFFEDLLTARQNMLPPEIAESAKAGLNNPLTSQKYANFFEQFFKLPRT